MDNVIVSGCNRTGGYAPNQVTLDTETSKRENGKKKGSAMGTPADFYVGRGANAEWLGTIDFDGYPEGIAPEILMATNVDEYRQAVTKFLDQVDDATTPSMGWPWPWNTSSETEYAYAFESGAIYVSRFGGMWLRVDISDEKRFTQNPAGVRKEPLRE
jgi:hypothetical protein